MLGLNPATHSLSAGEQLPATSHTASDRGGFPWHPDSPVFWAGVLILGTIAGVAGASVNVRAFRGRAGAKLGTT